MPSQNSIMAPHLAELEPGTMSLNAPVINGAIQINAQNKPAFCRLVVDVEPGVVSVRREDGIDLQIQFRSAEPEILQEAGHEFVLAEPVSKVVFRHSGEKNFWNIEPEDLAIGDMGGFEMFADTLANHALIKQRRENGSTPS